MSQQFQLRIFFFSEHFSILLSLFFFLVTDMESKILSILSLLFLLLFHNPNQPNKTKIYSIYILYCFPFIFIYLFHSLLLLLSSSSSFQNSFISFHSFGSIIIVRSSMHTHTHNDTMIILFFL